MIIRRRDIDALVARYERYNWEGADEGFVPFLSWLADRPHLPMSTEFTEFLAISPECPYAPAWIQRGFGIDFEECTRPIFRRRNGQWVILSGLPSTLLGTGWCFHSRATLPSLGKCLEKYPNFQVANFIGSFNELALPGYPIRLAVVYRLSASPTTHATNCPAFQRLLSTISRHS